MKSKFPIRSHPAPNTRQRGVAIVLAMGTVTLAVMAASAILVTQSTWARRSGLASNHVQAMSLVQAGLDWARAVLHEDRRASNIDHMGEPWALRLAPIPVDNGMVAGHMEDEQARFNLNNLSTDGKINPTQFANFRRLLSVLGFSAQQSESLADALADWIDSDSESLPRGAEDDYYLSMQPPYLAANRPLIDIAELAFVRGFDAEVRARLRPFVSALPRFTAVNVNTAPPEVLVAVIGGLTPDNARALVARRERFYFRDRDDFAAVLPSGVSKLDENISVSSDHFSVRLQVTFGEAESSGVALLARRGTAWPTVVWQKIL